MIADLLARRTFTTLFFTSVQCIDSLVMLTIFNRGHGEGRVYLCGQGTHSENLGP
jgi:type 1 glutamine amidotransferase